MSINAPPLKGDFLNHEIKKYSYKQVYILHDFIHKYVAKRYNATKPSSLNEPFIAFYFIFIR